MQTLNLANPDQSEIKFEVQSFPDGQQNIRLDVDSLETGTNVMLLSRFNSFKDLELILCATKALRRIFIKKIILSVPYLLGARSDRRFVEGGTSYLVDVVAPIINAQKYYMVQTLDVHSDVAPACIPDMDVVTNGDLVNWAIKQSGSTNYVLAIPDAGALKKFYSLAEEIGYTGPVIIGQKHRDLATGKIVSTSVDVPDAAYNKDIFIVDDICDGGRTFLELAAAIRKTPNGQGAATKLYLIVTHGIFSKGYKELGEHFEHIYCTDSVKKIDKTDYDGYHTWPTKVTQFPIF